MLVVNFVNHSKVCFTMQMKTYQFGLNYANSYRALKGRTNKMLAPFDINAFEWALLGLLYDTEDGLRVTRLAEELCVSKAMISKTCRGLKAKQLLEQGEAASGDKRAVVYTLTQRARLQIPNIERTLRSEFKKIFKGMNTIDLLMFYKSFKKVSKKLQADIDQGNLL